MSLVPIAVFQVRKHFLAVSQNSDTVEPVKALTAKLLDDFDKRYVPTQMPAVPSLASSGVLL